MVFFLLFLIQTFALSGLALGYLASYFLLRTVAYLSPWLPVWMWYGDIGLFLHAVFIASTSTVGIIAVLANKGHALKLCSYILASLLIVEILATVQLATRSYSLDRALYVDLNDSMTTSQQYYSYNISDTQMWDEIQLEVNCCGVISYEDWFTTRYGNGSSVPDSCCLMVTKGCGANIASNSDPGDEIILHGCLPTIMSSVRNDFDYYSHNCMDACCCHSNYSDFYDLLPNKQDENGA
ncbi:CD63 antigen [Armadillidium nasatum]|uniref:CD63 antigen n=1 Tax=Armadillidium nasatum TaxID=96803 RepID=A0A5N5SVF8_9CRUS|nr:CD63 antigen [Armadillidium nasatum]